MLNKLFFDYFYNKKVNDLYRQRERYRYVISSQNNDICGVRFPKA